MNDNDLRNKITVLIVEDDSLIQKIHGVMMTKFGAEVYVVANGKEATDLYHSGVSFDLILMDFEMPLMDGLEVSSRTCMFFNFLLKQRIIFS